MTHLNEGDREALGLRDAACGCCVIVDEVGLEETIARHRAEAAREGLLSAAEAMPEQMADRVTWGGGTGYIAAADVDRILRDRAAQIGGDA